MKSRGNGNGHRGFGVLPALTGLPASILCQCSSKMVVRAAFRCTGKKGQSAEDGVEEKREEEEERRGDAEEGDERGRTESTATPLLLLFCFQSSFPSFSSLISSPLYRKHGHKK